MLATVAQMQGNKQKEPKERTQISGAGSQPPQAASNGKHAEQMETAVRPGAWPARGRPLSAQLITAGRRPGGEEDSPVGGGQADSGGPPPPSWPSQQLIPYKSSGSRPRQPNVTGENAELNYFQCFLILRLSIINSGFTLLDGLL